VCGVPAGENYAGIPPAGEIIVIGIRCSKKRKPRQNVKETQNFASLSPYRAILNVTVNCPLYAPFP
jgi:hypothetical protein